MRHKTIANLVDEQRTIDGGAKEVKKASIAFSRRFKIYLQSLGNMPFAQFRSLAIKYIGKNFKTVTGEMEKQIVSVAVALNSEALASAPLIKKKVLSDINGAVLPVYGKTKGSGNDLRRSFSKKTSNMLILGNGNKISRASMIDSVVSSTGTAQLMVNAAQTLTRTAIKGAAENIADTIRKKDNEVIGYQWVSILDDRTSQTCQDLNGNKYYYKRSGVFPMPPAHPNCRSVTAPIYADSAKNEQALKDAGYEGSFADWAADPENQEQLLESMGPTRYTLYQQGNLKIERFTDARFNTLTVEKLLERNKKAAKRAIN